MQLPEPGYWDDINRYCDTILSGPPVVRQGNILLSMEGREFVWPAQECCAQACLSSTTVRALGVPVVAEMLEVVRMEGDTELSRFIMFNRTRRKIVKTGVEVDFSRQTTGEMLLNGFKKALLTGRTAVSRPTEEDYALLYDELASGAWHRRLAED